MQPRHRHLTRHSRRLRCEHITSQQTETWSNIKVTKTPHSLRNLPHRRRRLKYHTNFNHRVYQAPRHELQLTHRGGEIGAPRPSHYWMCLLSGGECPKPKIKIVARHEPNTPRWAPHAKQLLTTCAYNRAMNVRNTKLAYIVYHPTAANYAAIIRS